MSCLNKKLSKEQILKIIGDPKVLDENLRQFRADSEYFDKNYAKLRREYPDEWVFIYEQRVRAHGKDLECLVELLKKYGLDTSKVYHGRTYFKEKEPVWIFSAA